MSESPPFAPVPVRARRDGWTPAVQARFVAELARTRNVAAACRLMGRSWQTAYRLRARPDAAGFAAAWDTALAGPDLSGPFTGRALGGVATAITYRGKRVGERRRFDDRLAKYILRTRAPERFGRPCEWAESGAPDRAHALAAALAALRADPAGDRAPRPEDDPARDVARMSSPSAPARPAALAPARGRAIAASTGVGRDRSTARDASVTDAIARTPPPVSRQDRTRRDGPPARRSGRAAFGKRTMTARTSATHPLRIADLPAGPGRIGVSFCPGKHQADGWTGAWARDLGVDLDAIKVWGADAVVTLVEGHELAALKVEGMGEGVAARSMRWFHLPIRDVGTPCGRWERDWAEGGRALRATLRDGGRVFVHCKGGLGRAGTVAARLLVELGEPPAAAIAAVRAARPGAIETGAQERYVLGCAMAAE